MDVVTTQIKNILNSYTSKHVNTGDKIIDVAISVIVLALFDHIIKYLVEIWKNFNKTKQNISKFGPEPWNFNPHDVEFVNEIEVKNFKYRLDVINTSSKFRSPIFSCTFCNDVVIWIENTFGYPCVKKSSTTTCIFIDSNNKHIQTLTNNNADNLRIAVNTSDKIHMPIWHYDTNIGKDYVYFSENFIWSNSLEELHKCVNHIIQTSVNKHRSIINDNTQLQNLEITELEEKYNTSVSEFQPKYKHVGYVNKNKTFDKLFFDEKNNLLEMIEKYQTKTMHPTGLGLDNKLGILLYGPPGTGKTGTIFCIANMLKKPILLINSLKVKKTTILTAINDMKKTHVIVLDEFDHMLEELKMSDLKHSGFFNRAIHHLPKQEKKENDNSVNETQSIIIPPVHHEDLPNEVFLYKMLDSFGDDEDRIIIATTNNPDKVNPVLLRPGRFDMKLCLGYCSFQMFCDITNNVYNLDEYLNNQEIKDRIDDILKLNITPLVLINCIALSTSFDNFITMLSKQKQKYYNKKPSESNES